MTTVKKRTPFALLLALFLLAVTGTAEDTSPDWLTQERLMPQGERYEAEVPDTLDLAERARIALGGLIGFLDYRNNGCTFGHGYLSTNPPFMTRVYGKSQNWGKIAEDIVLTRRMCGSREDLDRQVITFNGMMDDAELKKTESHPVPLARIMLALIALDEQSHTEALRNEIAHCAQCMLEKLSLDEGRHQAYFGTPEHRWDREDGQHEIGVMGYWLQVFSHGTVLRSLVVAQETDCVTVPGDRLQMLKNTLLAPRFWSPEAHPRLVVPAEHGQFGGHHHSYTQALLGLLYYAHATGDTAVMTFVRESYEYMRTYGIARIGLFGEACTTGDMTFLAIRLSQWGVGDYWEDVDQTVRNHLVELQITDTEKLHQLVTGHGVPLEELTLGGWCEDVDTERVIERCKGIFLSDASHPTLIPFRKEHVPYRSNVQWVICCTGNCTKALYEAWDAIVDFDESTRTAQVNLLLNRASPWLDVNSFLPHEGRVSIRNKKAEKVSVRVPLWVDREAVDCEIDGDLVQPVMLGNKIFLTGLEPGDEVTITFPMVERMERLSVVLPREGFWLESTTPRDGMEDLQAVKYTLYFRGNTLVDIAPRDRNPGLPLYGDRTLERFRAKCGTRRVERFVAAP